MAQIISVEEMIANVNKMIEEACAKQGIDPKEFLQHVIETYDRNFEDEES